MKVLLALVALGAAACVPGSAHGSRIVTVTIEHSRFVPDTIDVRQGETVTFVVDNKDPIAHEFLIGDKSRQREHELGTEAKHGARPGEISIPALETERTTFTFTGGDDLIFGCHLPGHYDYGMRGAIEVR